MGFFTKEKSEPVYCGFCGKEVKGPRFLRTQTASGSYVCSECLTRYHLNDLRGAICDMSDEDVNLHIDWMKINEEMAKQFSPDIRLKEFKLSVDPVRQLVKFDNHHYIFETSELLAVVYGVVLDSGNVKGELLFYMVNPVYSFHREKVKFSVRGLLRSSQVKNLAEKLNEISVVLGDVPLLTPKEFKKAHKKLLAEKEVEFMEDEMEEFEDSNEDIFVGEE